MDIAEDVKGFDEWFGGIEGFSLRAERFDGDVAWLKAAYAAGVAFERERCAKLLEEGYERTVATPYRNDGVNSKNDQCAHGRYMYEDCEACAASAIRSGER